MPADAQRSVLVVDDDRPFAITLATALARRGYVAHVAHDAGAALATAATHKPSAAIVDLELGAENALELVETLRRADPQLHILVLTDDASTAAAVEAIKRCASDRMAKPLAASAVAAALERAARPKRSARRKASRKHARRPVER